MKRPTELDLAPTQLGERRETTRQFGVMADQPRTAQMGEGDQSQRQSTFSGRPVRQQQQQLQQQQHPSLVATDFEVRQTEALAEAAREMAALGQRNFITVALEQGLPIEVLQEILTQEKIGGPGSQQQQQRIDPYEAIKQRQQQQQQLQM